MVEFSALPIRRVERDPSSRIDPREWVARIPAVRQLLEDGLDLGSFTVFVGENGAGKSTIVEAIASAFGLNPEGGTSSAMHRTQITESPLDEYLRVVRGAGASRRGVFLRAETMHGHLGYLESIESPGRLGHQSHGESFVEYFSNRSAIDGLWLLDEPESALSFSSCLSLILHLRSLVSEGSQVILSTHSPILAAVRGADIYEFGDWGMRLAEYDDLEMVRNWRLFLDAPERFLRHLSG
ncbi:AAA family ATPase [Leucobacter sp. wl10]|uniref:AAA family ATPase n=1 Tax=Leucobacter sp. wl10 TaxID=2304677 RepID=UPI000E5A6F0C|nr:AAA family ATPase [Leucobacter sp. wl10]RGE21049.1 ATP-binding cassette domain-containing protein [Leucobacter sp. wl10]